MKIDIKYCGKIINLPAEVAEHAAKATKEDLCVIISLFTYTEYLSCFDDVLESFSERIGVGVDAVLRSLVFWNETGVISVEGIGDITPVISVGNRVPSYSGAQISRFIEENKKIASLFDACQTILEKSFNPIDYNNIIYLKDYFKFSDDYIMLLLAHCVEIEKSTWAYIRKTAKNLYEDGVDTYTKLEKHFEERKNRSSLEYKIRSIFGIGMRELSKKEREKFDLWISSGVSEDMIKHAYEITVNNTSKPSVAYATKIIENWIGLGFKTLEDIEDAESRRTQRTKMTSYDVDDFFEAALARSTEQFKKEINK